MWWAIITLTLPPLMPLPLLLSRTWMLAIVLTISPSTRLSSLAFLSFFVTLFIPLRPVTKRYYLFVLIVCPSPVLCSFLPTRHMYIELGSVAVGAFVVCLAQFSRTGLLSCPVHAMRWSLTLSLVQLRYLFARSHLLSRHRSDVML